MLGILALVFMIGAPIYAFIYPSLTSVFLAGVAATLIVNTLVAASYQARLRKIIKGKAALDQLAAEQAVANENIKH